MTTFADQLFQMGGVPVGMSFPTGGDSYFLDPANGNDDNDGKSVHLAFKTLTAAEDALTANQNDVLYYLAGSSSISLSALLTWDKSYTHFIGVCAPVGVGNRARIFQTSSATGLDPLINITASGCIFKNIYVFQGVDDATSLVTVQVTGARNYFENCHFAGGGHAANAVDGAASLNLNGGHENRFKHCTFGVDTIAAATGVATLLFDNYAARNIFEDCNFTLYAGAAGAKFVEIVDNKGFDRYIIFRDCLFINDATAVTLTEAFTIPGSMRNVTSRIILLGSMALGVMDWDTNDQGLIYSDRGTITAGGNAGLLQAAAKT